jgi:hypothetical protein
MASKDKPKEGGGKGRKKRNPEIGLRNALRNIRHLEKAVERRRNAILFPSTSDFKKLRSIERKENAMKRAARAEAQGMRIAEKAITRMRLRKMKPSQRAEAHTNGNRQFGEQAKPWHLQKISRAAYDARTKG